MRIGQKIFAISVLFFLWVNTAASAIFYPNGSTSNLVNNIVSANSTPYDDIVDLGGYIYVFDGISPALTLNPDGNFSALPTILTNSGKLSIINGSIRRGFQLGSGTGTPFRLIYNAGDLTLFNITLENGYITGFGDRCGGGINNGAGGILSIDNTVFSSNYVTNTAAGSPAGGGICNNGMITRINRSVIAANFASITGATIGGFGAGIANSSTGYIQEITNSTISGNIAVDGTSSGNGGGGGIFNSGTITNITNNTISGNISGLSDVTGGGGGIDNTNFGGGACTISNIINNTIAENTTASAGGGILNEIGCIIGNLTNNTIVRNVANTSGGGISNFSSTIASLTSNIVAGNTAGTSGSDMFTFGSTVILSEGYNLFSSAPVGPFVLGPTDITQSNASSFLGPLRDNGGLTFTVAPLAGSLAINNGLNINALAFDQRGSPFVRVARGNIDIGAFELQN